MVGIACARPSASLLGEHSSQRRRSPEPVIHWRRRWRHDCTPISNRRILDSAEGYRVIQAVPHSSSTFPVAVYALRDPQTLLKVCRSIDAAKKVCERDRKAATRAERHKP